MKKWSFWLFMMVSISAFGQLNNKYQNIIEKEINKWVNIHRSMKGYGDLEIAPSLQKAATMHSKYMAEWERLTHQEENEKFREPFDRVYHFQPDIYEIVGENILKFPLPEHLDDERVKKIGQELFQLWKNSPPHYQNILNPKYEEVAYALEVSETGFIYATQVFGTKGYHFPIQLSDNAFGVKTKNESECYCNDKANYYDNITMGWGNGLKLKGDSVFLYVSDIHRFKEVMESNNDGLALDVLLEEQFPCFANNQLDQNYVHDGLMLPPRFKDDLIKDNRALNPNRLITFLGVIPKELHHKELEFSLILINQNKLCQYIIPIEMISKRMELFEVEPRLNKVQNNSVKDEWIAMEEVEYTFAHNEDEVSIEYLNVPPNVSIERIEILSFSSIDGNSDYNKDLAMKRGQQIKKELQKHLNSSKTPIAIQAKENWELMYYQIKMHYAQKGEVKNFSPQDLKALVKSNDTLPWSEWLDHQRTSKINIYFKYEGGQPADIELSPLTAALKNRSVTEIQGALYHLCQKEDLNYQDILALESDDLFYFCKTYPSLMANYLAALHLFSADQFTLSKLLDIGNVAKDLNEDGRHNFLLIYTDLVHSWLIKWDLESRVLHKMIHPKTIEKINSGLHAPKLNVNMLLNNLNYYHHILDYYNSHETYKQLAFYFEANLKEASDLALLAQFYNLWSTYDRTISLYQNNRQIIWENEDAIFAIMTACALDDHLSHDFKATSMQAHQLNPKRWCDYMKRNRQLLRHESIKEFYCNKCDD